MSTSPLRHYQQSFTPYPSTRPQGSWPRSQPANITPQGSYSNWTSLGRRRNTLHDASTTEPTGMNGYRATSLQSQPESQADLVVPYAPVHVSTTHAGSGTVLETGVPSTGSQTSPIDRAPPPRSRHARQPSYTRGGHGSIEVTSKHSAGRSSARSRTKTISDSVSMSRQAIDSRNHAVPPSPSASATYAGTDPIPFWSNGRGQGIYVPENLVSETRSSQSPYPHEAGGGTARAVHHRPDDMSAGLPTSGIQANDHSISAGTLGASHYPTARSSYSSVSSLQPGPAPPIADHLTSVVNSASQPQTEKYPYPTQYLTPRGSLDYSSLPHQAVHAVQSPVASFSKPLVGYEGSVQRSPHYYSGLASPSSSPMQVPSQYSWNPYVQQYTVPDQGMMDIRQLSDLYNTAYLAPPPNPQIGITSPLQHPSPPSEISTEEPPISPAQFRRNAPPRHPGQRVDVDQQFLEQSFVDGDEESRIRRLVLDEIQMQSWFIHHEKEPQIESRNDPFSRGLGTVGRSIYTVFLAEDKESNQWRCLFGGDGNTCKKAGKRFERVERAIEHIRSHLGHRPFACDGTCAKSYTTKTPCGKRFFASGYLEDHKKRPQKRTNTSQN